MWLYIHTYILLKWNCILNNPNNFQLSSLFVDLIFHSTSSLICIELCGELIETQIARPHHQNRGSSRSAVEPGFACLTASQMMLTPGPEGPCFDNCCVTGFREYGTSKYILIFVSTFKYETQAVISSSLVRKQTKTSKGFPCVI